VLPNRVPNVFLLISSADSDSAWADTSVDKAVGEIKSGATIIVALANVIVALEEHVVKVDHLCQDIGLLLRADFLRDELDIEQVTVSESFSESLLHLLGLEFGNGGKVSERGRVKLRRVVCHVRADTCVAKDGFKAELAATSSAAWSSGSREDLGFALGIFRVGTVHHLHDGLETTSAGRLNTFAEKLGALALSLRLSGLSAKISGMDSSVFLASVTAGKAANAWLGARSGEATIATLTLEGHKSISAWFVGPVNLLSRLELRGALVYKVKLNKDRVSRLAAAARPHVGFFFDDHDTFVGFVIKDIVDIWLFPATLSNGFNHTNTLLDEEGVHARENLDGFLV